MSLDRLKPDQILFSQKTIGARFKNAVYDTPILSLSKKQAAQILKYNPIRVWAQQISDQHTEYVTYDNRRLALGRILLRHSFIPVIICKKPPRRKPDRCYHVRIRGRMFDTSCKKGETVREFKGSGTK